MNSPEQVVPLAPLPTAQGKLSVLPDLANSYEGNLPFRIQAAWTARLRSTLGELGLGTGILTLRRISKLSIPGSRRERFVLDYGKETERDVLYMSIEIRHIPWRSRVTAVWCAIFQRPVVDKLQHLPRPRPLEKTIWQEIQRLQSELEDYAISVNVALADENSIGLILMDHSGEQGKHPFGNVAAYIRQRLATSPRKIKIHQITLPAKDRLRKQRVS